MAKSWRSIVFTYRIQSHNFNNYLIILILILSQMQSRRSSYEAVTRTPTCGKVVLAFASSCDLESVAWWMTRLAGRVGSGREVAEEVRRSGGVAAGGTSE